MMSKKKNQTTFEESLNRLENLVNKMESGDATLEQSLVWFEEGMGPRGQHGVVRARRQAAGHAHILLHAWGPDCVGHGEGPPVCLGAVAGHGAGGALHR